MSRILDDSGESRQADVFDASGHDELLTRMRMANLKGAALLDEHKTKAKVAMALRAMRKSREMTQDQLRITSEMIGGPLTQAMISRMESPTGHMPQIDSLMRYAAACGGRFELRLEFDPEDQTKQHACERIELV